MVTDCVQVDLKCSIIQTELGLSELNQSLPGKKQFLFFFKDKDYVELITNSLLTYCSSYKVLDFQGTGISIITFLNNGQMQLPHFAECYLKGTTPSRNIALLATRTQSEPKWHLLTFSIIDAGDYVQPRHLKFFFFLFHFLILAPF